MSRSPVCSVCHKPFKTAKAAKQHHRDVHAAKGRTVPCTACDKTFGSASAAEQHFHDVHGDPDPDFNPPYDTADGEWVWAREFTGRKSFGVFECNTCSNVWLSAHAQTSYAQACRDCDDYVNPVAMWVNQYAADSDDESVRAAGKPHHAHRCEACHAGQCSVRQ